MTGRHLKEFDDNVFLRLGGILWRWEICAGCLGGNKCATDTCQARRLRKCQRYFQFYQAIVVIYSESSERTQQAFITHEDLWNAIKLLQYNPDLTRAEFAQKLLPGKSDTAANRNLPDLLVETTLVVKVLAMVDCSALHHSSDRLEKGGSRIHWKDDVPFAKYLQDIFPTGTHPFLSYPDSSETGAIKSQLKATKLQKRLEITFRATHDIRNHLRLYRKENVLEIYHHAAFLKEQLRLTRSIDDQSSSAASIDALPRQLVLEVLESLQGILFPLSDRKSKRLLRRLVCTNGFDPEIMQFEFASIRRAEEENVRFVYLADRLAELYNESQNPQPRGWLQRRMERRSGARYMMMATLIGVVCAVLLGIGSLVVSSYQTWIAYQAWQHPVAQLGR
ncbi:hypothetical protein F4821DRAFT_273972 [Hypoxylon rubiginosum]|uniref:Uncharacterized protein n=1 Tax=Hypoxylon rubiginosum TaxID=110542 RepID=A0ACC0CIH1_9PEZI|nr:hypothetical protein F4821DRAFT_273972 [Hypoxylon rubiginosum]